jgi:hypothetical protein
MAAKAIYYSKNLVATPGGSSIIKEDHRNAAKEKNHAGAKLQPIDHWDHLDITFFNCAFTQHDSSIE